MNFYFKCNKCGKSEEVVAPIGTSPRLINSKCDCGGIFNRLWLPLGVTYRCSGFYHTDKVLSDPTPDE